MVTVYTAPRIFNLCTLMFNGWPGALEALDSGRYATRARPSNTTPLSKLRAGQRRRSARRYPRTSTGFGGRGAALIPFFAWGVVAPPRLRRGRAAPVCRARGLPSPPSPPRGLLAGVRAGGGASAPSLVSAFNPCRCRPPGDKARQSRGTPGTHETCHSLRHATP